MELASTPLCDAPPGTSERPLPHDRRAAAPLALVLLEYTLKGTRAEQLFVYRACADALGVALDEDQADTVEAVMSCRGDLGLTRTPSRADYRRWFDTQPSWAGWPTPYEVQRVFGTWRALRTKLDGTPDADLRTLGLSSLGPRRDDAALLAGIRRWHEEEPDPQLRFSKFREWARKQLRRGTVVQASRACNGSGAGSAPAADEEAHALASEIASSPNVFIDRFGSWVEALDLAGVLATASFETFKRLVGGTKEYTEERLVETLQDAAAWAKEQGARRLTRAIFDRFRDERLRQNWETKTFRPVPSAGTISSAFGSFPRALLVAGVVDARQEAGLRTRRGKKLEPSTLAAHVHVCATHCGYDIPADVPKATYTSWRNRLAARLQEPVPAADTICARLGTTSWREAARLAAEMDLDTTKVSALDTRYRAVEAESGPHSSPDCRDLLATSSIYARACPACGHVLPADGAEGPAG